MNCLSCSSGKFGSTVGLTLCNFCPAGEYSNISGASACLPCRDQTYSSSGAAFCLNCEAGKIGNGTGDFVYSKSLARTLIS